MKKVKGKQQNPNICAADHTIKMRGKEREKPKAKKPTKLKQVIIQDRAAYHGHNTVDVGTTEPPEVELNTKVDTLDVEVKKEAKIPTIPLKLCARE